MKNFLKASYYVDLSIEPFSREIFLPLLRKSSSECNVNHGKVTTGKKLGVFRSGKSEFSRF